MPFWRWGFVGCFVQRESAETSFRWVFYWVLPLERVRCLVFEEANREYGNVSSLDFWLGVFIPEANRTCGDVFSDGQIGRADRA